MNVMLEKLIDLLQEESIIFMAVFGILEEETNALIASDLQLLNEVIKKKENEILKIRLLETQREKIIQIIAQKAGCSAKGLTLSKIAALPNNSHSETLVKISQKLEQFTQSIRLMNQKNKKLVEQSIGLVRDSLSMLDNLLSPVPIYHNNGKFSDAAHHRGRLLSGSI